MFFTESIKTVGVLCNKCGHEITATVNYFQLADRKIQIKCPICEESMITLNATDGDTVLISVPCTACGESHSFTRKIENFFKSTEDIFRFMCPFSGIEICFIGDENRIAPALMQSEKDLMELISEYQKSKGVPEDELYEEKINDANEAAKLYIKDLIYSCAEDDNIVCVCKGMKPTTNLEMYLLPNGIKLTCKSCGRSVTIKCKDVKLIEEICESGRIEIK